MKEPRDIYVVCAEMGEFDDYVEWPIHAFCTEEAAEKYAVIINGDAERLVKENKGKTYPNRVFTAAWNKNGTHLDHSFGTSIHIIPFT